MRRALGTFDIAIVGGGASGTLVATNLLRFARSPLRLAIVERGPLARGPAYSTNRSCHLLNVPACNMSGLPDEPDDFLRWMRSVDPGIAPGAFVERRLYGPYLEARLRAAEEAASQGTSLDVMSGEARRLRYSGAGVIVEVDDDRELVTRRVVLALGNAAPEMPQVAGGDPAASPRFVRSPWIPGATDGLRGPLLLLGTGLTMVDTALALAERGHRGELVALSRHGLLPSVHTEHTGTPAAAPLDGVRSVADATRLLRRACEGADWRAVFGALRPRVQAIWSDLPLEEKRRFLRHLRTWWDVHRHRMPPSVAEGIERLRRRGALRLRAGRLVGYRLEGDRVAVRIRPRGSAAVETIRVSYVINCTGPDPRAVQALVKGLYQDGLAKAGPLDMGLATDGAGALVARDGTPSGRLFTLGPLRRGELWETTAIPEIREQALALSRRLLAEARPRPDDERGRCLPAGGRSQHAQ